MALFESSNRRMRRQNALLKIVVFIFANTSRVGDTNCIKTTYSKAIQSHNNESRDPTNHFELLMPKHGRPYSAYELRKKSIHDNES